MRHFVFATLAIVLACSTVPAEAQVVIKGTVTAVDETPLSGVNVRVLDTPHGAATSSDGSYQITGPAPGTYDLLASSIGFETSRKRITLEEGEVREIDFTLSRTTLRGDEVVVTGTMRETYVKDSPVKVDVVRRGRLERGTVSSNLMDMISGVNGLSTQLNCGVCGTNAIRVNGVEGPNTAVLVDGMPVMGALASVYGLNGINPSIIDQVEVIRGPQSTLYGTQALGGVVNVITKDPSNTPSFLSDVYMQSTREGSVSLAAAPEAGRFEGFVSGNALRMEHFIDDNGDGFADTPRRSRISLFGKGTLAGPEGGEVLGVATKFYGENRTGGPRAFRDDLRGSDAVYGESIYTRRAEAMVEYRPPQVAPLRVRGALTYHNQDSYYGTEHYVATQRIAYGQATWSQSVTEGLRLLAGATARYETYDDNTPATSAGADRRFVPGVFGQGKISLGDMTLLGGLRLDHHDHHGVITAPRLSAKYSPSPQTTVRANAGTGFRIVNVFTEDHAALTGSREVVFTEDLAPERSRSVTASIEHIVPFGANPLTVGIDGFYTRFANKIIPNYDRDPDLIVYENLDGHSTTRGVSVSLDQNFTVLPVTYNAAFTLMDVFTEQGGTRTDVTYAPDYTGTFGATYDGREVGASLEYTGRLVGSKRMPDFYVDGFGRARYSPVYSTHDVKLTKSFSDVNGPEGMGLDVYASVENIFNRTQGSPLANASDPFSSQFDTVYTWGPLVGRTFSVGVRVSLR